MIKYDEFPFTELEWKMCSFVIQILYQENHKSNKFSMVCYNDL